MLAGWVIALVVQCALLARVLTFSQSAPSTCGPMPATTSLFALVADRAALMLDVATAKAADDPRTCVYDAAQEVRVLDAAVDDARDADIAAARAVLFAQVQADCAKQQQAYFLQRWRESPPAPTPSRSLPEVRSHLRELNAEIFRSWRQAEVEEWAGAGCGCLWEQSEEMMADAFAALNGPCAGSVFRSMLLASLLPCSDPR